MARHILIAGDANSLIQEKVFKPTQDIDITNTFYSLDSLTEDVMRNGISFLQLVSSVVILDYGFTSPTTDGRVDEFIHLQDTLKSNSLRETKLYLITKDADLYSRLQKSTGGIPGVHYINTIILLIEGKYKPKILGDILRGGRDRTGLYHPDVDKENLSVRLIDDRDTFIEDSRTVSQEILKYGTDLPVSELSKVDYTDSPAVTEMVETEEREAEKRRKEQERKSRIAQNKGTAKVEAPKKPKRGKEVTINRPRTGDVRVQPIPRIEREDRGFTGRGNELKSLPNLRRLQRGFESLQEDEGVIAKKVDTDSGVISFVGERKAGASGLVANIADTYATAGKTVLVVDLDVEQRSQTLYFGGYDKAVEEHLGLGNGLIKVAQGGTLQRTAVQITSRVSVLGISRKEMIDKSWVGEIAEELPNIIEEARHQYDMVLIDVPYSNLDEYLPGFVGNIDKNIFVIENKWYDIENFIYVGMGSRLMEREEEIQKLFKKSTIVLNKYKPERYDGKGEEVTRQMVSKRLMQKGFPYDLMSVVGEIPYYGNWEVQYLTNTRYIWEDRLAVGVYRYLINKVVW